MMNLILHACGKTSAADELSNVLGDICGGDTDVIELYTPAPGVCPAK